MAQKRFWIVFLAMALISTMALTVCDNGSTDGDDSTPQNIKILTGIEITSPPSKSTFLMGETLDLAGLCVENIYDDDSREPVSECGYGFFSEIPFPNCITMRLL